MTEAVFVEYQTRIEELEDELFQAKEFIAQLTKEDEHHFLEWAMSGAERRILGAMTAKGKASHEMLIQAMYWDKREADWPEAPLDVLRTLMPRLRRKLAAPRLEIITLTGFGYALERVSLWRLRQILAGKRDPLMDENGRFIRLTSAQKAMRTSSNKNSENIGNKKPELKLVQSGFDFFERNDNESLKHAV